MYLSIMKRILLITTVTMLMACSEPYATVSTTDASTITIEANHSGEGSGGLGYITLQEGEKLYVEYQIKKGSFDMQVLNSLGLPENGDTPLEDVSLESITADLLFEEKEISGEGVLEYDLIPGEYPIFINFHNMTGEAYINAKGD